MPQGPVSLPLQTYFLPWEDAPEQYKSQINATKSHSSQVSGQKDAETHTEHLGSHNPHPPDRPQCLPGTGQG